MIKDLSDDINEMDCRYVIGETSFSKLGEKYRGKVRDCYIRGCDFFVITTDRLSAFDVVITTIPFKGASLQHASVMAFKESCDICPNHIIDVIDPNILRCRKCERIPFEVVVRGYLAGGGWREYQQKGTVSGVALPPGLREFGKLPESIITPTTKAGIGQHDVPISREDLLATKKVSYAQWEEIESVSLSLFELGCKTATRRGLILADTKYEFGLFDSKLMVIDEMHTVDSSRYWVASSYDQRIMQGEPPEMLDKEPIRRWLASKGFSGSGEVPAIDDSERVRIANHYVKASSRLSGVPFVPSRCELPHERMASAIEAL